MPNNMVSAPAGKNTFPSPSNNDAPSGNGGDLGGSIKGFGSAKPDASTVNAVGGSLSKAPKTPGPSVGGFTNGGLIPGKI